MWSYEQKIVILEKPGNRLPKKDFKALENRRGMSNPRFSLLSSSTPSPSTASITLRQQLERLGLEGLV